MNRQFPYNWIKDFIKLKQTPEQFAKEMSLRSQAIEKIIPQTYRCKGIVTAKVLAVKSHPNADRLRLATVDTGKEQLTVVCGAPNLGVNQIVAFAPVGATVLNPENLEETYTLTPAKIRGVESHGMICATDELGLGGEHAGILTLPNDTPLGIPFETLVPPDDVVFDIEITSNRPDAMAVFGLALEAAAVFGKPTDPKAVPQPDMTIADDALSLKVKVEDEKTCARYLAAVLRNITIQPSPLWLQLRLIAAGIRPINNIVDITNYVLLEYGQPMHVFDYAKINHNTIVVRQAKTGESLKALDEQTYQLKQGNLVIADTAAPMAIAGVMGGAESAVQPDTTTIVFEAATFAPMSVRKTSRQLNLQSESSSLFEKGLHTEGAFVGMLRAIELAQKIAGGQLASPIIDVSAVSYKTITIELDPGVITQYLGITLPIAKIKNLLELLGYSVKGSKILTVTVPWWRANDTKCDYDLVEEVARLYGYHVLPSELPATRLPQRISDPRFSWEDKVKDVLAGIGMYETYSYSMVRADEPLYGGTPMIQLANPLSDDMQVMRTSLVPQMIVALADNATRVEQAGMFELSNVYRVTSEKDLPEEQSMLALGVVGVVDPLLYIKGVAEHLLKKLHIEHVSFVVSHAPMPGLESATSLEVRAGAEVLGMIAVPGAETLQRVGIKKPIAIGQLSCAALFAATKATGAFEPVPEYPSIERDIAVIISRGISWQQLHDAIAVVDPLITDIAYQSTYSDESIGAEHKSIAFRITCRANDRTLRSEEVDVVVKKIVEKLTKEFQARQR